MNKNKQLRIMSEKCVDILNEGSAFISEWFILFFYLYIIYLIMKKPKTTATKPVTKAGQPTKVVAAKITPEKPIKTAVTKAPPKKSGPAKKAQVVAPKAVVETPVMTIPERIGLAAGSIWHYLDENGVTTVAKLLRELEEEEKIIQRSIGWLAQEGKIILDTSDRVETIKLKD